MDEPARVLVGRYELLGELGRGAMGVVWRARDPVLGREVAVKQLLLPAGLAEAAAEQATARAMREARTAARLHHPNAISVFDVVTEDGQPWLVMEYLPSRSLAEVLADGSLAPAEAARVGARVAAALAAAHELGIVHRDVKPGNILLGDGGTVKITDFGIARAGDDVKVTETGLMAGTPAYLAPEVAAGAAPSPAADVFSLGATLYAAIEGAPPFGLDENHLALLNRVAAGQYAPAQRAGRLVVVLDALLATDPPSRLTAAEAAELLAEAADLLAGTGPSAHTAASAAAGTVTATSAQPADSIAATAKLPADTTASTGAAQPASTPPTADAGVRNSALPPSGSWPNPQPDLLSGPLPVTLFDSPAPRPPSRRSRWELLAAVAVGLAVLGSMVGIRAVSTDGDGGDSQVVDPARVTSSDIIEFVDDYYDALPNHPEAAYDDLAPDSRPAFNQYADFWEDYQDVDLDGRPTVSGGGSTYEVDVRLELERDDDNDDSEVRQHHIQVAVQGNRLVITEGALLNG